jgi:secreted trypsin-like serine protease
MQVAIFIVKNRGKRWCGMACGGVIVGKNHILSAAHCFEERPVNLTNIYINVGSTKKNEGTTYNVTKVKIHESYDNVTKTNDIAVLTLSQDIEMSKDVAAACLPTEPVKNYVGQTLIVSGWGKMRDVEKIYRYDLQVLKNLEIVAKCPISEVG